MNEAFLAGALAAWAVAYCSVAVFFMLANLLAGRDREYLLFGFFVLSLAVLNAGCALLFHPQGAPGGLLGNRIAISGGVLATLFQLQFALRYSGRGQPWSVGSAYVMAAMLLVWTWAVRWDAGWGSPEDSAAVRLLTLDSGLGATFSIAVLGGVLYAVVLMLNAYRRGRVEALLLVGALAVVGVAAAHDILVINTPSRRPGDLLSPYIFWVYVVAMAATLLIRYRGAEGRLAEAAASLRARTEELRRSHAELEKVQSELVRKEQLAAVGELAASIAHEVRNPLAVIVNANAGLRRRWVNEGDRETLLSIIDEETERLNRLVAELLRFARPVTAKRSAVSLTELCEQVRKNSYPSHPVYIEPPADPGLDTVWVDPGLFRVVLDNLVANARQAMRSGGRVSIVVRDDEFDDGRQAVAIDVSDEGHGMDYPVLQRALHPFFTTRPSGTGLGLPIVQRIVEAHGGDLRLTSHPGRGTTATLRVPRARPGDSGHSSGRLPVELTVEGSEDER